MDNTESIGNIEDIKCETVKLDKNFMMVTKPIKKDGIKAYVVYTVVTNRLNEPVYKRFSDFYALREKLQQRWPGVYIPNIPPKKIINNLDNDLIQLRVKILDRFCKKLVSCTELFKSEEVKIFLLNVDVGKTMELMPNQKYEQILEKYKLAFGCPDTDYDANKARIKLSDYGKFLKKIQSHLKNYKEILNSIFAKKEKEMEIFSSLITMFTEYEKNALNEYSDKNSERLIFNNPENGEIGIKVFNAKEKVVNPYQNLCEWIFEEEIDVEAMIETVLSINNLFEQKEKILNKISDLEKEIATIESGRKSLKSLMNFTSSKDELLIKFTSEKSEFQKNLIALNEILRIVCFNLEKNIQIFKSEKTKSYYFTLKNYAQIQILNSEAIGELWTTISNDNNIKCISNLDLKD